MKAVDLSSAMLDHLILQAGSTSRKRQHCNVHTAYDDPVQRMFNAIEPGSYVRPHRHSQDPRVETLLGIRGAMTFIAFNDSGEIIESIAFGPQSSGPGANPSVGIEVPPGLWHTVVANEPGSVLFEIKAGPFDASKAKEWAEWAPAEGGEEGLDYLAALHVRLASLCGSK